MNKLKIFLNKILYKNIIDLRILTIVDDKRQIDLITKFLSSKTVGNIKTTSKLRDLEINLANTENIKTILTTLSDNYMIKTVRLTSESDELVDYETERLAETFKNNRVGTEIWISSCNKKFKKSKIKRIEVFYPDAL